MPTSRVSSTGRAQANRPSTRVIPFFETNPLLSAKQQELEAFVSIVRAMERGEHLSAEGFRCLRQRAVSMNGGGRYRRIHRV